MRDKYIESKGELINWFNILKECFILTTEGLNCISNNKTLMHRMYT